jgi:hypothetical protein
MNPDLQQKLFDKYPKIFQERELGVSQSCMAWGPEVGDGWYSIIDLLCYSVTYTFSTSVMIDEEDGKKLGISPTTDFKGNDPRYFLSVEPPQFVATQIKEKFGGLRVYYRLEFDRKVEELLKQTGKYQDLHKIMDRYSSYMDGVVHFAEMMSYRTCEVTGGPGEMHIRSGWYKVLNRAVAKTEPYIGYEPASEINKNELP